MFGICKYLFTIANVYCTVMDEQHFEIFAMNQFGDVLYLKGFISSFSYMGVTEVLSK